MRNKITEFALLVYQERRLKGWTQETLARKSGVSIPMIQLIEAGKTNASLNTVVQLAEVLDIECTLKAKGLLSERLAVFFGLISTSEIESRMFLNPASLLQLCENHSAELTQVDLRLKEAVEAILLCIVEYYPSFGKQILKNKVMKSLYHQMKITGRIIKMKRIALPKLIEIMSSA